MKEKQLTPLIGKTCEVFVDMKRRQPFRYQGKVLEVSKDFFTILDTKTNKRVMCPLDAIISIIQEGDSE